MQPGKVNFEISSNFCYNSQYDIISLGVTMGAHRLWSHRAFKAKPWLKIFLLYMHTLAGNLQLVKYDFLLTNSREQYFKII